MYFESELILSRRVIRIRLGNTSERWISEACPTAAIANVEVGRIGDIETLRTELHFYAICNGKVLEDGQIHMAKVGPEQRIPTSGANRSKWLRGEGRDIKELGLALVVQPGILDLIRAILTAAVERRGPVVVAMLFPVTLNRVIGAAACLGNCERLTALPCRDRIHLPSRKSESFETGEVLSILKGIIERQGKAILDIVFGDSVLDLTNAGRIAIAPALAAALLGETSNIAQKIGRAS